LRRNSSRPPPRLDRTFRFLATTSCVGSAGIRHANSAAARNPPAPEPEARSKKSAARAEGLPESSCSLRLRRTTRRRWRRHSLPISAVGLHGGTNDVRCWSCCSRSSRWRRWPARATCCRRWRPSGGSSGR
jgi:hypothetical protein